MEKSVWRASGANPTRHRFHGKRRNNNGGAVTGSGKRDTRRTEKTARGTDEEKEEENEDEDEDEDEDERG